MSTTILTDEQKGRFVSEIVEYGTGFVAPIYSVIESVEQAVLQSEQVKRLKKIEAAAEKVLSMYQEDGYIVLPVHLDELRASMEKQT